MPSHRHIILHPQHAMQSVNDISLATIAELEQLTERQIAAIEDPILQQILRNAGERSINSTLSMNVMSIHGIAEEVRDRQLQ